MAYLIEVDTVPAKYKSINFVKKHPSEDCDEFSAIVAWSTAISQFSNIQIKKDAVILYCGFAETINPVWDEGVRYKQITGRCHKVFLWKKFTERYERGNVTGFFGSVNPSKLARLLLRCPISEWTPAITPSVFHRIGYGFDLDTGKCSAISQDLTTHPEWCRLRCLGFRWLLGGYDYEETDIDLFVDNFLAVHQDFTHVGAPPWLNDSEVNYIWINNQGGWEALNIDLFVDEWLDPKDADWTHQGVEPWIDAEDGDTNHIRIANLVSEEGDYDECYGFADIDSKYTELNLTVAQICVKMLVNDPTASACVSVEVDVGDGWEDGGTGNMCTNSTSYTWLCTNFSTAFRDALTPAKVNAMKVKIIYSSCAGAEAGSTHITAVKLHLEGQAYWAGSEGEYDEHYSINNYTVPSPTDTEGNARAWRPDTVTTISNAQLGIKADMSIAGGDCTIRCYLKVEDGGSWISCPAMGVTCIGAYTWYMVTPPAGTLDTIDKINYARLKIVYEAHNGGAGVINICSAKITFDILVEETDYQREDDWFKIDLGEDKERVMGVLIESRYADANDRYARNYEIEYATNAAPNVWHSTTPQAAESPNSIRDIIEAWSPVTCRYVRIRITADSDNYWEISQVFVWQGEDPDYLIKGDGTDVTIGNVGSANFEDYAGMITPISFGFQRVCEAINQICKNAHATYTPWEWWVEHNATHDFHFESSRGTDKSGTVIFERGKHIKSVDVEYTNRGTTQRARYIGRGEGKGQDEIASEWQINAGGIGEVNTFYEKIVSEKSVGDKDQADVLAKVYTEMFGEKRVELTVVLNYDPWEGQYEVGDEIWIKDASQSIDSKYRLTVIDRTITNEPSNETVLTLTNQWYDITDLWAEIKRELRNVGLTGTVTADWRAEGGKQDELDTTKMTDVWSAQSKNEEIEPPPETDDDRWNQHPETFAHGQFFRCAKDCFVIRGTNEVDVMHDTHVWLLKDVIENYDYDLFGDNFIVINQDFTHVGAPPWLNESDVNYIWINNQVASEGKYDEYYWLNDIPLPLTFPCPLMDITAKIMLRAKMSLAGASCTIRVYLKVEGGGSWIDCGGIGVGSTGYTWYELTPPAGTLDTIEKINYAQLKIVYETHGAGAGTIIISQAKLDVEIECNANGWIDFSQDPRFVTEIKLDNSGAVEDYTTFGMLSGHGISLGDYGFGFRITRIADEKFKLETYLLDEEGVEHTVYLQDLLPDVKYRLEAVVEWDERLVKWYVDNDFTAIMPFDETETGSGNNLHPFNVLMWNTYNATDGRPYIYIYNYRAQARWEA